jgi:ABC-type nitrate/sulfonate/bicarbonate transport system permease component
MEVVLMTTIRRFSMPFTQLAVLVGFVALWQWASVTGRIDPFFLGRPSTIWDRLSGWMADGTLWGNLRSTVVLLAIGYAVGLVAGFALGWLMGASRLAHAIFEPYVVFMNAVPRIILYPFLVVWLGFGQAPKIISVILVMVPIVAINIATGYKSVEGQYLANMRAQGAGRTQLALHVYVPSLSLWVLSTCRVTFGLAFQAAISAELITSTSGLGYLAAKGQSLFDVNAVYAALAVVTVVAIVVDSGLGLVERRATRWMPRGA